MVYISGALFFGNVQQVSDCLPQLSEKDTIIFSLRGISFLDISGAQMLMELFEQLKNQDIKVILCGVQPTVKKVMVRSGSVELIGEKQFYWSVDKVLLKSVDKEFTNCVTA